MDGSLAQNYLSCTQQDSCRNVRHVCCVLTDGLGDHDWGSNYTLDGKTNHNSWNGMEVKTSQQWAGDSLAVNVLRSTSQYKENWSLSADGKTLTVVRHTIFARSDLTETFVYDKQ